MTFTPDALGLYATTTTNDLGHVSTVTMDTDLGVPINHLDANGVPTTRKHDRFGRLREVNHADGSFARFTTAGPLTRIVTVPDGLGGTREAERTVLDRLGRPVEDRTSAFDGSVRIVSTTYDLLGRLHEVSQPHAEAAPAVPAATYDYDMLDRVKSIVAGDRITTASYTYNGLETHRFDGKRTESYVRRRQDGPTIASAARTSRRTRRCPARIPRSRSNTSTRRMAICSRSRTPRARRCTGR